MTVFFLTMSDLEVTANHKWSLMSIIVNKVERFPTLIKLSFIFESCSSSRQRNSNMYYAEANTSGESSRRQSGGDRWRCGWLTAKQWWCQIKRHKLENQHYRFNRSLCYFVPGVSGGHSVLTCWPSALQALHKSPRRRSYDRCRQRTPPLTHTLLLLLSPSLLPPVLLPLSKCHLANKTPVHTEPEQNTASSIHTGTVRHSNKRCHLLTNPAVSFLFFLLAGAENFSPLIKEGIIANMAEIPTLIPILCVCVRACVIRAMQAMKKPIVVVQVCLISVYTTMSVVLWSPLVRLFVGLFCEPSGNAEGNAEDPCVCVCILSMSVIRDTHQRSCLSGCGLIFVSPASSASRMPLDLRRRGPAAPGSGGTAARCASQGPGESSSAQLFTLCPLIT